MPRLRPLSGDEFVRVMRALGYQIERTRGSHMMLRCHGRKPLTVPRHRELDRGTLRGLIRDAGLTVEEFMDLASER